MQKSRKRTKAIARRPAGQPSLEWLTVWVGRWATPLAAILIVLATTAAYSNTFRNPFIFDDEGAILQNLTIRRLWPIWPVLLPPANGEAVQRRPVVNVSLAVNYAISGYQVWSYHALNLLAHVLAALLLFGVVRRTVMLPHRDGPLAATPLALAVALLWAVHPLLTEAVTYVVQRTEVLAGLFYLLTLYCVIRGAVSARGWTWYAAAVAACGLAMGSKEVAISAPLVTLLYDRVFLSPSWRQVFRRRWGLYLGLAATWAVILIMLPRGNEGSAVFTVPENARVVHMLGEGCEHYGPLDYALTQFGLIAHYLRLCFWPHPLVIDYGLYTPLGVWQIVPYALLIGGLGAATLVAFRDQPWLGFLGVWFFAILAPSSSVVPLFQQIAAEKRMYLPLAAVVTAVVAGGYLGGRRLVAGGAISRRAARATALCVVALASTTLAVVTFHRNIAYCSAVSIWGDVVAKMPNNARAHNNLGNALARLDRTDAALAEYRTGLRLNDNLAETHYCYATTLVKCGRPGEAIQEYRRAVELQPGWAEAHYNLAATLAGQRQCDAAIREYEKLLELKPEYVKARSNLADLLLDAGRASDAVAQFQQVLKLRPDLAEAHYGLGAALADAGRFNEAIASYRAAVSLKPDYADAFYNLAAALAAAGQFPEAIRDYRQVLRLQPQSADACNNLARLLAACPLASVRNGPEAVALASRAVHLSGGREPMFLDTLAAACAEAGRFPEALRMARQAADLAAGQNKAAVAESIRAKIPLYQAGTPYRGK